MFYSNNVCSLYIRLFCYFSFPLFLQLKYHAFISRRCTLCFSINQFCSLNYCLGLGTCHWYSAGGISDLCPTYPLGAIGTVKFALVDVNEYSKYI